MAVKARQSPPAAEGEMNAFWDKGGLSEFDAYEHGYFARAILETALESDPDNFRLLSSLRRSIGAITIISSWDYSERYPKARAEVLPVAQKQAEMLFSGQEAPSIEAMLAMYDFVKMAPGKTKERDIKAEGLIWIIENAEAGDWQRLTPKFERDLEMYNRNIGSSVQLYVLPGGGEIPMEEWKVLIWQSGRYLPSVKPKKFMEHAHPLWQETDLPIMESSRTTRSTTTSVSGRYGVQKVTVMEVLEETP